MCRFGVRVLERTCSALDGRRVAALLVCGGGSAAAAVVAAAARAGVPVLRASPTHVHLSYAIANVSLSCLKIVFIIGIKDCTERKKAFKIHVAFVIVKWN